MLVTNQDKTKITVEFVGEQMENVSVAIVPDLDLNDMFAHSLHRDKEYSSMEKALSSQSGVVHLEGWYSAFLADFAAEHNGRVDGPVDEKEALSYICKEGNFSTGRFGPYAHKFSGEGGWGCEDFITSPVVAAKPTIAWLHLADVTFLQPFTPELRFKQYTRFNEAIHPPETNLAVGKGYGMLAERTFAVHSGSFDKLKVQMLQSVFLSVYGVFVALIILTPVSSAFFSLINLVVCVTNILGFMHWTGQTFNPVTNSICVLSGTHIWCTGIDSYDLSDV